jgi:hypothetical protein
MSALVLPGPDHSCFRLHSLILKIKFHVFLESTPLRTHDLFLRVCRPGFCITAQDNLLDALIFLFNFQICCHFIE